MEPELPLRDIHLPAPVGWWPPAPGWWVALALLAALIGLAVILVRRWRRQTLAKLGVAELKAIEEADLPTSEKLRRLSILLRRVGLSAYPRTDVAGLTGEAWLKWLDQALGRPDFSEGPGRLLLTGPYQRLAEAQLTGLFKVCRDWLQKLPGKDREPRRQDS